MRPDALEAIVPASIQSVQMDGLAYCRLKKPAAYAGPNDAGTRGVLYGGTLAQWFGVPEHEPLAGLPEHSGLRDHSHRFPGLSDQLGSAQDAAA